MPRDIVTLACDVCNQRNYVTTRNRRTQQNRYERKTILSVLPKAYSS